MIHLRVLRVVGLWMLICLGASSLSAAPITFVGTQGGLSASAIFEQQSAQLKVTLTNTSLNDVLNPTQVLTAVFFSLGGYPLLSGLSATLAPGSTVLFGGTDPGGGVGGEWAYKTALVGAPGGATAGISSSGLGLFGPHDLFPGSNLQGPQSPGGLQYGITSAGDNPATGNTPVTGSNALIRNAVAFTLGLPAEYTLGNITNVSFQYGTALNEPNIPGVYTPPPDPGPTEPVPEPATFVLLGSGLIALGLWKRRQYRSRARQ